MGLFGRKKAKDDEGDGASAPDRPAPAPASAPAPAPVASPVARPEAPSPAAPAERRSPPLIFASPEPLSAERHATLGVKRERGDFSFARGIHMIPVMLGEIAEAAVSYPVVFVGDDKVPHAVVGARPGQSILVRADGSLEPGLYVPAFLRRYPFGLAAADKTGERYVLCIDRASDLLVENGGERLFVGGEPSELTKSAMRFAQAFEQQRRLTQAWAERLKQLDLFEMKEVSAATRQNGDAAQKPAYLARYHAVSAAKLDALPAEELARLREGQGLLAVYAHLVSAASWKRVLRLAVAPAAGSA